MKEKKTRKKRRALTVAELKLGGEPVLKNPTKIQLAKAFNWFNSCSDPDKRKAWVLDYMKDHSFEDEEVKLFSSRGKKFSSTHAHLARMLQNGSELPGNYHDVVDEEIRSFLARNYEEVEYDDDGIIIYHDEKKETKKKVDHTFPQACEMIGVAEERFAELLAGGKVPKSIYGDLTSMGCKAAHVPYIMKGFAGVFRDFAELLAGDPDMKEAYSYLTKKQVNEASSWLEQFAEDLLAIKNTTRQRRKAPRKKKDKPVESIVKNVKYQPNSAEYKLVSEDPTRIVGAKSLWLFNTKTRQLSVYESDEGLTVKGTTLQGFNNSEVKVLRKPEEIVHKIAEGSKINNNRLFKQLTTKPTEGNGRINSHTIILKAIR